MPEALCSLLAGGLVAWAASGIEAMVLDPDALDRAVPPGESPPSFELFLSPAKPGTAWLFASQAMRDNPVDVLVVDEAGQLGLADTLAATISATNVILLGDPQQLPQVSKASHPGGSIRREPGQRSAPSQIRDAPSH